MMNQSDSLSLEYFLYICLRHRLAMFILAMTMFISSYAVIYLWPELYAARTTILVKLGRETGSYTQMAPSPQQQIVSTGVQKEDLNSEIEIIKNRYIIEKVVKELGVGYLYPPPPKPDTLVKKIKAVLRNVVKSFFETVEDILVKTGMQKRLTPYEKAVKSIEKNLTAEQIKNTNVIQVLLLWPNPETAKVMVGRIVDLYASLHLDIHKVPKGHDFFNQQVTLIGERLQQSEDRLRTLKEKEGITSYDSQRLLLLEKSAALGASLKSSKSEFAEIVSRTAELRKQIRSLVKTKTPAFNIVNAEAEKELLQQSVRQIGLEAKIREDESHITAYNTELERLNRHEIELKRISRQIQIDEDSYQLYRKKLEEARIVHVLDDEQIVNVRVIDPVASSFAPVKPKKLMLLGICFVASIIVSLWYAFIREYFDHSIKSAHDVSLHLGLPVLGLVGEIKK